MSELTLAEVLLARIAEDKAEAKYAENYIPDDGPFVRWDSDRVLAECEAKRQIVELHTPARTARAVAEGEDYESCPVCDPFPPIEDPSPGPCETLRLLALPYREEFKP